jgi:hypothetical protein
VPETGYSQSPKVMRGALVQLAEDVIGVVPNIIPFQYNPETVTRAVQPWNPFEVDQTNRGAQAPTVQPYDPEETYSFSLELHAADGLADGDPLVIASGVAARIAALRKLTEPTKGLIGDLINTAQALAGASADQEVRATVPIILLVLGPSVILPVRVTEMSVEIKEFTPLLFPLHAEVELGLRVLTPDVFKCRHAAGTDLAIAAYNLTRLQEDALAVANIANAVSAVRGILPF